MKNVSNVNRLGLSVTARKSLLAAVTTLAMAALFVFAFAASALPARGQSELDALRGATEKFKSVDAAQAAGYQLVPGLDHCFDNPGVGAMGYHYINPDKLDLNVEALAPEAMVYEKDAQGQLHFVAVEYIVPAKEWNAQHSHMPMLHGQMFHLNEKLGVLVLHVWIGKENPRGIFDDWNPNVSCSAMLTEPAGMPRTGAGPDGIGNMLGAALLVAVLVVLGAIVLIRRSVPRPE